MESLAKPIPESDFDPPSPSPARCFDLGAACARSLANSPWRVALLASSSWSHAFMTRKHSFLYPDTEADRTLFEALKARDYGKWRCTTLAQIEDSGQQELLNWFCLIGAMAELKRSPDYASFVETNIMNSNKVIAVYRP
jgi:Catalytic LigB subunit of aromatic ring-opening dioxygenase